MLNLFETIKLQDQRAEIYFFFMRSIFDQRMSMSPLHL